jgi:RecB family endonuclease NucS
MECVLRHHADVFAAWGLADMSRAQRTLALWLAGADRPAAELRSTGQKRSLGEREVEQAIQENWSATPFGARGLKLVARQRVTPVNTIDLLARNPATDTWWVLELKRQNSSDAVVGQLSRYRGWIASHYGVAVEQACGIILTDKVSERLRHAVRVQQGVELWCYDDQLALELVRA